MIQAVSGAEMERLIQKNKIVLQEIQRICKTN